MSSGENLNDWRPEILGYQKNMYEFHKTKDIKDILEQLSAFSARASWLRGLIIRSPKQEYVRFRIDELDPFIDEVREQFKIWSRYATIVTDEYKISKGQM